MLLCSDGLTTMIPDDQVVEIMAAVDDPAGAADALVTAANEAGGVDNISVVVVDIAE